MEFLDLAKHHFGEVHFIWTHRNIYQSLPSFLSMVAHSQTIFSDAASLEKVARHWVRKTGYMLAKGISFRQQNPGQAFTDVFYEDTVSNPMQVLETIYRNVDPISPELRQRFLETEKQNAPNRFGSHRYQLEDFGLTQKDIQKDIHAYADFLKTLRR
jgi:hypothetical protein